MLALGCDHGGYELMQEVKKHLENRGIAYHDFGCSSTESVDYPIYGKKVAEAVARGEFEKGILICGTGIGISIAANKVKASVLHFAPTVSVQRQRDCTTMPTFWQWAAAW